MNIGLIIIATILVPVILLIGGFVIESRRKMRVPGLFIGSLALQLGGIIIFFIVFGTVMALFVQ